MNDIKNIYVSFSEAIRSSELKEVSIEFAENMLDSIMKDGILKEIPLIGTLFGINNLALTIKDKIFLKKIVYFFNGINHISVSKRQEMIDSVNSSSTQKVKVGEKLIYILDKCEDHISAKYIAQLFCAFLNSKLSYQDFLRGARIIQNILLQDLEDFLDGSDSNFNIKGKAEEIPSEDHLPLINVGICGFGYNDPSLEKNCFGEKEIQGGDAVIWITDIGKKLKKILYKEN